MMIVKQYEVNMPKPRTYVQGHMIHTGPSTESVTVDLTLQFDEFPKSTDFLQEITVQYLGEIYGHDSQVLKDLFPERFV